ncbi:MAG: ATP-binding protein [Sedimentisphaerales bacterium]|nr:ATP-binding protein [Sedimentisphaerales bacterium]
MESLFNKPLSEVTLDDIESLAENKVPESRTLDYKRDLYGENDAGKREFLIDVSAFANTLGGYLLIGIEESDGIPKHITGIEIDNTDQHRLKFENLLRTGVDPPIRGIDFHAVKVDSSRTLLIIEIPRSVSRPHAVTINKYFRFYGRNSTGNFPFQVDDIRRAIVESETFFDRIRIFRSDRIAQIASGETPVPLPDSGKLVLHVIPSSSFESGKRYELGDSISMGLKPIYASGGLHRYNFDGIITYRKLQEHMAICYTQIFHSGIIEAVDTLLLTPKNGMAGIPSLAYEKALIKSLKDYLSTIEGLGVGHPTWICLSLLGIRGYRLLVPDSLCFEECNPIDRDELIIPEIQIVEGNHSAEDILKPAFDSIWNACGYKRSFNYNEDGNWMGERL